MSTQLYVCQSNYIPWKGYFDAINSSDIFVLYDIVQYTKNDWRNRNMIKTQSGREWLTIPVRQASLAQTIDETTVTKHNWNRKHWNTLRTVYGAAPCFKYFQERFEHLYMVELAEMTLLSEINECMIRAILELLGSTTRVIPSSALGTAFEVDLTMERNDRLVSLCKQLSADVYLSGAAAKVYLDKDKFASAGIAVEWADYGGYPEYPQLSPPFEHGVTILDLLFNTGKDAPYYLKSFDHSRRAKR